MNIALRIRKYIDSHMTIKKNLSEGIINYSGLARKIQGELGLDNFDAVLIAIRRYADRIQEKIFLEDVKKVLEESSISYKHDFVDLTISTEDYSEDLRNFCDFMLIGSEDTALITHENNLSRITSLLRNKIRIIRSNMVLVKIMSDCMVEDIPNFIFYLLSIAGSINIVELASFSNETILLIDSKDLSDFKNIFNK